VVLTHKVTTGTFLHATIDRM